MFSCACALLISVAFEQTFIADAEAEGNGKKPVLGAAARASEGKRAPIAAVDDDTLALYPTAEKCGECHNQIY